MLMKPRRRDRLPVSTQNRLLEHFVARTPGLPLSPYHRPGPQPFSALLQGRHEHPKNSRRGKMKFAPRPGVCF